MSIEVLEKTRSGKRDLPGKIQTQLACKTAKHKDLILGNKVLTISIMLGYAQIENRKISLHFYDRNILSVQDA